ncbi:MAG: type I-E CRISPR-associated protein Cas6/Cse3/CasE [Longimicrobiales bacterium]
MAYLSRAALRLEVVRGFNATYVIHQLVADHFGDRSDRGYLYRVLSRAPREAEVLILSTDEADPDPPHREWGRSLRVESRPYDFVPEVGQSLDFEVRLNATRVVTDEGRKSRTDVWDAVRRQDPECALEPHDVYAEYLERQLDGTARLHAARVVERGLEKAARPGRRPIPFVSTNLIGTLEVSEPDRFIGVVAAGVGRAKAFGHGLLCLSRPGTILPRRYGGRDLL